MQSYFADNVQAGREEGKPSLMRMRPEMLGGDTILLKAIRSHQALARGAGFYRSVNDSSNLQG